MIKIEEYLNIEERIVESRRQIQLFKQSVSQNLDNKNSFFLLLAMFFNIFSTSLLEYYSFPNEVFLCFIIFLISYSIIFIPSFLKLKVINEIEEKNYLIFKYYESTVSVSPTNPLFLIITFPVLLIPIINHVIGFSDVYNFTHHYVASFLYLTLLFFVLTLTTISKFLSFEVLYSYIDKTEMKYYKINNLLLDINESYCDLVCNLKKLENDKIKVFNEILDDKEALLEIAKKEPKLLNYSCRKLIEKVFKVIEERNSDEILRSKRIKLANGEFHDVYNLQKLNSVTII